MTDGPPAEGESYSDTDDPEVLNARMRLDFVDWWRPAAVERPWVRLLTVRRSEPFQAWWDLGNRWDRECGYDPVIEVPGLAPGDGPRIDLPDEVDTVGWWILSRVDPEQARGWVASGVTSPFDTWSWGTALGLLLPSQLGCEPLATRRGWWAPTDDGYGLVRELLAAGIEARGLWGPGCRRHLELHAPEIFRRLTA